MDEHEEWAKKRFKVKDGEFEDPMRVRSSKKDDQSYNVNARRERGHNIDEKVELWLRRMEEQSR